jgi:hypothetical protein
MRSRLTGESSSEDQHTASNDQGTAAKKEEDVIYDLGMIGPHVIPLSTDDVLRWCT